MDAVLKNQNDIVETSMDLAGFEPAAFPFPDRGFHPSTPGMTFGHGCIPEQKNAVETSMDLAGFEPAAFTLRT